MSSYEQKDMTGSLFRNDKRESDHHPEVTGSILIEGKAYWLSGWVRESAQGKKYFSLAAKPKDAPKDAPRQRQESARPTDDLDDSIPF